MKIYRNVPLSSRGFTLIELLATMSIIALITSLSMLSIRGLTSTSTASMNLTKLSGVIERARQHAVTFNTRAWIGFATSNSPKGMQVVLIASKDGTNPFITEAAQNLLAGSSLEQISKIVFLDRLNLVPSQAVTSEFTGILPDFSGETVQPTDLQEAMSSDSSSLSVKHPDGSQTTFTHFIEFNPNGQIEVNSCIPSRLLIGLKPNSPEASSALNSAIVSLDGQSGQLKIYRR